LCLSSPKTLFYLLASGLNRVNIINNLDEQLNNVKINSQITNTPLTNSIKKKDNINNSELRVNSSSHSGNENIQKDSIQNVFKKFDNESSYIMKNLKDYYDKNKMALNEVDQLKIKMMQMSYIIND